MSNKQFAKIIDKIKKEDIKPLPKWKVDFKSYLYWFVLGLLILIGGLLISLTLIDYLDIGQELARNLKLRNFLFMTLRAMPFLWIILLGLSLVFGAVAFRSTKRGYRYSILSVLILMVILISVLVFIGHISKVDQHMKNVFDSRMYLNKFNPSRENKFSQPEKGVIAGRIKEIEKKIFILKCPKGEWTVHFSEDTKIKGRREIAIGRRVLVVGDKIDQENFQANAIIFGKPDKIKGFKTR